MPKKKKRLPVTPGYDPNVEYDAYTLPPKEDPLDEMPREILLEKLKAIRDVIWPFSQMYGYRDLHRIPPHQALEQVKEVFEEPLRMTPIWKIDPFFTKKIEPKP